MTSGALYCTLHQFLVENKEHLKSQDIDIPNITKMEIQTHFEFHAVTIERTVVGEIRQIQEYQERIKHELDKRIDDKLINLYLRLSNARINLIHKMQEFESQEINLEPYKFT